MNAGQWINPSLGLQVDFSKAFSLARPLVFNEEGVGAFDLPNAASSAVTLGDFVGDTTRGGSVNCKTLVLHPHGNGTHTESAAHVEKGAPTLAEIQLPFLDIALVFALNSSRLGDTGESYEGVYDDNDRVFARTTLEESWSRAALSKGLTPRSLVIGRVQLEEDDEHQRHNPRQIYFTNEAMHFIREKSIEHLLVEEASIDRLNDGGTLSNHRIFFGLAPRFKMQTDLAKKTRTVTELIRAPSLFLKTPRYSDANLPASDDVDGANGESGEHSTLALLSLSAPPWHTDAAPSTPLLFPLSKTSSTLVSAGTT